MTIAEYRTHTTRTLPNLGAPIEEFASITGSTHFNNFKGDRVEVDQLIQRNSDKLNYVHMAMGLAGEIGELVECIGTELRAGEKVDKPHLREEIGDIYWYLANFANMRHIEIPETLNVDIPVEECLEFLIIKICDLVDLVKKFLAYNRVLDKEKEVIVVCDIRLALLLIEKTYNLDGAQIRATNIIKLNDPDKGRYKAGFSDEAANNRDLNAERELLK